MASYTGVSIALSKVGVLTSPYYAYVGLTNNCVSIQLDDTPLISKILGFSTASSRNLTSSGNSAVAPVSLTAIDTCIYMKIINIPIPNNNLILPYTFKIPLNNFTSGSTIYYADTYDIQSINFEYPFFLNKLDIQMCDRYGVPLIGYLNWTCSFVIESI